MIYWSPAVAATFEAGVLIIAPALASPIIGDVGAFIGLYSLVSCYWLLTAATSYRILVSIGQRSVFQRQYPRPLDYWDEDDD